MTGTHAREMESPRCLVLGLGSHHGDDQAGWEVIAMLEQRWSGSPYVQLVRIRNPLECLSHLVPDRLTWIIDACQIDTPDVPYWRGVWPVEGMPASSGLSSHGGSLRECLEMAQYLQKCPRVLVLFGVPGTDWEPAGPMGEQAARNSERVTAELDAELRLALGHAAHDTATR